ncbi:hypothetical protein [Xanthomonas oryzae]|uniref:hypothetical protein n=1 Tax=Xanthomonas oryzae TaxID=347 RepID=UPI0011BD63D9|nr:hypothetical protein [Xanthomonas oryzae]
MIDLFVDFAAGALTPIIGNKINKVSWIKLFLVGFGIGVLLCAWIVLGKLISKPPSDFHSFISGDFWLSYLILPTFLGLFAMMLRFLNPPMTWRQAQKKILNDGYKLVEADREGELKYIKDDIELIVVLNRYKSGRYIKVFKGGIECNVVELREG